MTKIATFSIALEVEDAEELFQAAVRHYCEENGESEDEAGDQSWLKDWLKNADGTINIANCLIQLLDPGLSPGGCSIVDSTAEVRDD
jgi:hypothetical protein